MERMISFRPGHNPPHVTNPHLSLLGSKYILLREPARSKDEISSSDLIACFSVLTSTLIKTRSRSVTKFRWNLVLSSWIGDNIFGSPSRGIVVSMMWVFMLISACPHASYAPPVHGIIPFLRGKAKVWGGKTFGGCLSHHVPLNLKSPLPSMSCKCKIPRIFPFELMIGSTVI